MLNSTLRSVQLLRGIAVLSVVFYHIGFFTNGYIGVDLFFAISGFVIFNSISKKNLFESHLNAKKDLLIFLKKRFWRIYPALLCVVSFTLFYSIFQITWLNNSQKDISKYGLSSILSYANLFSYKNATNYFEAGNTSKPLLHLWSVSVEIQLYLFFGIIMLLISWLKISKINRNYILVLIFLITLTFSEFYATSFYTKFGLSYPEQLGFYSPINRSWEFMFGCLIYLMYSSNGNRRQQMIYRVLTISCIIYMLYVVDSNILKLTFIGFVVFIHFARNLEFNSIFTPLINIGDRSYSIYLWHMPIIYFFFNSRNSTLNLVITLILIYSSSHFTFRFVEQKYRNGIKRAIYKKLIIAGAIPTLLIIFLYFGLSEKITEINLKNTNITSKHLSVGGWELPFGNCSDKNIFDNHCIRKENFLGNMIIGDSHAGSFTQVVNNSLPNKPFQFKESYIHPGCSMVLPSLSENAECTTALDNLSELLIEVPRLKIYYSEDYQLYGSLFEQQQGDVGCTAYMECAFNGYIESGYGEILLQNLKSLGDLANQEITLIGAAPRLVGWPNQFNVWNLALKRENDVYSAFSNNVATKINNDLNQKVINMNNQGQKIKFIDPTKFICLENSSKCKVFSHGLQSLYWDADHLSVSGAQTVFNRVLS